MVSEDQARIGIQRVVARATNPAGQRIEVGQMSDGGFAVLCDGRVVQRFKTYDDKELAVLFDSLANRKR